MLRCALLVCVVLGGLLCEPTGLWAQGADDAIPRFPLSDGFPRGPGFNLSFTKIFFFLLLFWAWAAAATWVGTDSVKQKIEPEKWNGLVVGCGFAGLILFFIIPWFWLGYPLALVACIVPFGFYTKLRNNKVPEHEQIFTPDHLKFWFATQLRRFGIKLAIADKKKTAEGLLQYKPKGAANSKDDQVNLLTARRSPAFIRSQEIISLGLDNFAETMLLDLTAQGLSVRYEIDGLWEQGDPSDLETAKALAAVYLQIANLKPDELRARQQGTFGVRHKDKDYLIQVTCMGTPTGARMQLLVNPNARKLDDLEQLGMPEPQRVALKELLKSGGIFLVSSPPTQGLSTTLHAVVRHCDRLMRSFISVEDAAQQERKIDNVDVQTYNSAIGETPATILQRVIRLYPDAYVCRHLPNVETLKFLFGPEIIGENKLVVSTVRAKEAAEAPFRLLMIQDAAGKRMPPAEIAPKLLGVVNTRLVRKLCTACKEAYVPDPQLLQQLGLGSANIEHFFQPPVPRPEDKKYKPCKVCNARGYLGRTAMFEVLIMNDRLRQVLIQAPKLDVMRVEARKAGMRTLQEEGIRLIATGVTSLEELQRVLKDPG